MKTSINGYMLQMEQCLREGLKKRSDFYNLGGGQRGSIITFYFFIFLVSNVLKIIYRPSSFFKSRGGGTLGPSSSPAHRALEQYYGG